MPTRLRLEAQRRTGRIARTVGEALRQQREDAGLSQHQVAVAASLSQAHVSAIEAGTVAARLDVLQAIAFALGGEVSIKFYAGTGPRLRDRFQAPMVEAFLRVAHPRWQRYPEVPVQRPASGVIDVVLADPAVFLLVATEFQSQLSRLEQQLRWAMLKAEGLPATTIGSSLPGRPARVDRLLVLRSTAATRTIARDFEATLAAAFPAPMRAVLASLMDGAPWPGSGVIWMTNDHRGWHVMERQPPGVALGR